MPRSPYDDLPDARDGLTRAERVVLWVMHQAKAEFGERHVPTILLWGRVVEYVDMDQATFQRILQKLNGTLAGDPLAGRRPPRTRR